VHPKKSLGQNFFNNKSLAEKIVSIVLDEDPKGLLEIGPGRGFFTKIFRENAALEILAVEKDDELASNLRNEIDKVTVLNSDFLNIEEKNLRENMNLEKGKFVCFGSLPYNVSKPIIHMCIQMSELFSDFFFIIQKEVAEKLITHEPKNSYLALKTEIFATTKKILDIRPGSFTPRPNVESSLIRLVPNDNSQNLDVEKFEKLLQISFSHPRKTLNNNLKAGSIDIGKIQQKQLSKRPQELSFKEFIDVFSSVQV